MTWRTRRLRDVAELVNGFPFDSVHFADSGDVPLVRIRDLLSARFETFVPQDVIPPDAMVRDGDVVIGMDGDFNVVHWSRGPAALNQRLCLLRANDCADSRFIAYALPDHLKVINDLTYATTVKHLSAGQVRSIRIPAPDLHEQRAIADYLDRETARIDTLIEEQQRLVEMLKERRHLVFAHFIPEDAPLGRMKWDTNMVAGGTPSTDVDDFWLDGQDPAGTPFVSIADMSRRSVVQHTAKSLSEKGMNSRNMPLGGPGTLLLAMYASVGEVASLGIQATWNQALLGIEPNPNRLDSEYLRLVLLRKRDELLRDVRSNTQSNLNGSQVGALWIPVPSLDEQRRIAAQVNEQTARIEKLIIEAEQFIDLSRERGAALITAAVTGQIDVNGEAA